MTTDNNATPFSEPIPTPRSIRTQRHMPSESPESSIRQPVYGVNKLNARPIDTSGDPTYLIIDGENIDATLGMSVLGHRPEPDERPRWDRILEFADNQWTENTRPLFFLNASSGHMPMGFIQALMAMEYTPIPLSSEAEEDKVVDIGVQRTLQAIIDQGYGNVLLGSHDGDFLPLIRELLDQGRHVGIFCFVEFLSSQIAELVDDGLELYDLEHDIHAFQVALPRLHIIPLHEFNPVDYLS